MSANLRRLLAAMAVALSASGCSIGLGPGTTQSVRYFVLSPQAPEASTARAGEANAQRIGVMPVQMPDYLERPELIVRTGSEISPRPFSAWATPLDEAIPRVLAQNLARLRPGAEIAVFPWRRSFSPSERVRVQLERFEIEAGQAVLHARWQISGNSGSAQSALRSTRLGVPVAGDDDRARVDALSAALAQFSADVAQALER